jgi:hypothetical protein
MLAIVHRHQNVIFSRKRTSPWVSPVKEYMVILVQSELYRVKAGLYLLPSLLLRDCPMFYALYYFQTVFFSSQIFRNYFVQNPGD